MKLYRFSPITTDGAAFEALEYIDTQLRKLSDLVLEEHLPVNTLKIFAHYEDEYVFLKQWVDSLGGNEDGGSATSYYVKPAKPMAVNGDPIEYAGIRVPDPYRAHVGCGDFVVDDFDELKEKYLGSSPYIRTVPHQKYEMLELFHPDIMLLDMLMPLKSGIEVLQEARIAQNYSKTTVILLSNLSDSETINTALKLGAVKHLIKSNIVPQDLVEVISEYC